MTTRSRMGLLWCLAATSILLSFTAPASAQYPNKPIKLVVPFAAGGPTDALGRALAAAYAGADVFVFPSRTDTFGLVLLEALACGTPVAAFPVAGPLDVIGDAPVGRLDEDLRAACLGALEMDRALCRSYAEGWSWDPCIRRFRRALVPRTP